MAGNHFYQNLDFGSGRYKFLIVSSQGGSLETLLSVLSGQGCAVVDIGYELSDALTSLKNSKNFSLESEDSFRYILNRSISLAPEKPVFLHNLGILADPCLKLDPEIILKSFSRNHPLVILWDQQIEEPALLHWGDEKETFNLNFNDISPGIIVVDNEIQ